MSDFDFPTYESDAAPAPAPAAPQSPPQYLTTLNDGQRQAVEALDGPVLVLAGAGTGKTRVLTTRLAHLLYLRRAFPSQMLAVTFTNKAALEMRERLEKMIGNSSEGMWLGTFHSIAARILRRHAEVVGLKQNFTILDTDDQLRLAKQILQAAGFDDKAVPARSLLGAIERWKDRGLTPDKVGAKDRPDLANGVAQDLYRAYQERLLEVNAADFGDLLLHNLTIFAAREDILADYQRRFRYILVDEYQDTNVSQYLWLRLLARQLKIRDRRRRRRSVDLFMARRRDRLHPAVREGLPGAKIVRLEQVRHPDTADPGRRLESHRQTRTTSEDKTLWTSSEGGERVVLKPLWDGIEEARWAGEEIETLQRRKQKLSEIAILVRTGFQTREFEERFITLGLPYRVIGGPRFYERQEIRDALAYLRLVHQPADDLAFERIVNVPRAASAARPWSSCILVARAALPMPRWPTAGASLIATDEFKPAARRSLSDFLVQFDRWREVTRPLGTALSTEQAAVILDESGYTAMWQADKSADAPGRLENLKELLNAMAEFRKSRRLPRARQPGDGERRRAITAT